MTCINREVTKRSVNRIYVYTHLMQCQITDRWYYLLQSISFFFALQIYYYSKFFKEINIIFFEDCNKSCCLLLKKNWQYNNSQTDTKNKMSKNSNLKIITNLWEWYQKKHYIIKLEILFQTFWKFCFILNVADINNYLMS